MTRNLKLSKPFMHAPQKNHKYITTTTTTNSNSNSKKKKKKKKKKSTQKHHLTTLPANTTNKNAKNPNQKIHQQKPKKTPPQKTKSSQEWVYSLGSASWTRKPARLGQGSHWLV